MPAATASSSPLEWKAMHDTTKSKCCRSAWGKSVHGGRRLWSGRAAAGSEDAGAEGVRVRRPGESRSGGLRGAVPEEGRGRLFWDRACAQRHCRVVTSQIRTDWSSEPEAGSRLLCGWNLTVQGVRSWPVSTHSTVQVAQRNTCPGRGGRDHAATRDRAASLHTAVAAASGGAREAGGTRPLRHSARARRRTPACPPPRPRGACWGV